MKTIELASGDQIPVLGLGTWKMSDGVGYEAVKSAIENGYRHIDCAWIYQNESDIGRALNACLESGVVKREQLWVTSKLWNDRHRGEHVADALKETLQALQLDFLDLYLVHWPVAHPFGIVRPESGDQYSSLDEVPLTETWQAMLECVEAGLCRNVGVSNFNQVKLEHLISETGQAPACNQVESHPLLPQNELLKYCRENQIAFTAYSPLGSGDRPDEMKKDNEPKLFEYEPVRSVAAKHNITAAQVLLAWAVNRGTIPIPKSANAVRQAENLAAADIQLDSQDLEAIDAMETGYRYVDGKFWEVDGGPYFADLLWNA